MSFYNNSPYDAAVTPVSADAAFFPWRVTGRRLWPWLCMAHNLLLVAVLFR